ncbi:unnamed protein product [Linum tenue]|uniref:Secreted protein n=1 Tax=Linum tenue TaxID=586396 RepID=A0AAV0RN95_9ROSI|nr:unnamed protein product [Linum tenue]
MKMSIFVSGLKFCSCVALLDDLGSEPVPATGNLLDFCYPGRSSASSIGRRTGFSFPLWIHLRTIIEERLLAPFTCMLINLQRRGTCSLRFYLRLVCDLLV